MTPFERAEADADLFHDRVEERDLLNLFPELELEYLSIQSPERTHVLMRLKFTSEEGTLQWIFDFFNNATQYCDNVIDQSFSFETLHDCEMHMLDFLRRISDDSSPNVGCH